MRGLPDWVTSAPFLIVVGAALALIIGWKMLKLAFKVAIIAALIVGVYWLGLKAGWWAPVF